MCICVFRSNDASYIFNPSVWAETRSFRIFMYLACVYGLCTECAIFFFTRLARSRSMYVVFVWLNHDIVQSVVFIGILPVRQKKSIRFWNFPLSTCLIFDDKIVWRNISLVLRNEIVFVNAQFHSFDSMNLSSSSQFHWEKWMFLSWNLHVFHSSSIECFFL